jgi:hypothetical protein
MATMRGSDPRGNRARSVVRPPLATRGRPISSPPGIAAAPPRESLATLPSPAGQGPLPSRLRPPSARSHATPRSSTAWPRASAPGTTPPDRAGYPPLSQTVHLAQELSR